MALQRSFQPTNYTISRKIPPHKHSNNERFTFSGCIRLPNPDQSSSSASSPKARALAVYFVVSEVTGELPAPTFDFSSGEVVAYVHEREWDAWVDLVRNERPLTVSVARWSDRLTTVSVNTGNELVGEEES